MIFYNYDLQKISLFVRIVIWSSGMADLIHLTAKAFWELLQWFRGREYQL